MKIRPVEAEMFPCGRTDGHTDNVINVRTTSCKVPVIFVRL